MNAFDVFISYSHVDAALAERLSRRIRSYRPPRALRRERELPARLAVFRDVERLTTEVELGPALRDRVAGASNLLLICSPSAATSQYVDAEVAAFVAGPRRNALQVVLAAGDPGSAYPAALREAFEEPLYVDLRPRGSLLRRRRRFRDESLRIIAGLLGVDYATLWREDERRARRQRLGWIAALLVATGAIGGTWLASTVPEDAWEKLPLPTEHAGNRLLPVRDVALARADPTLRLYRVDGAEYAAQRPVNPIALINEATTPAWRAAWQVSVRRQLRSATGDGGSLVARYAFEVREQSPGDDSQAGKTWGRGRLDMHAFVRDATGGLGFAWSLTYRGRNESGTSVTTHLPPMAVAGDDPLQLQPWPASEMIRAGILPRWGRILGTLQPAWGAPPQELVYRLVDAEESFIEANDGRWLESAIVGDGDPARRVGVGGREHAIDELEPEDWLRIVADPAWAKPERPDAVRIGNLVVLDARVSDDGRPVSIDVALLQLLKSSFEFEPEVLHAMSLVLPTPGNAGALAAASVVERRYNEITALEEHRITRHFLRPPGGGWQALPGLHLEPGVQLIGAWVLDAHRWLLLTDRQGLQLSRDGGSTWREFNHGEPALRAGSQLRILVAGDPAVVHVLVDRGDVQYPNILLRHVQRSGWQRLRLGLAGWLLSPRRA